MPAVLPPPRSPVCPLLAGLTRPPNRHARMRLAALALLAVGTAHDPALIPTIAAAALVVSRFCPRPSRERTDDDP